MDGRECSGRTPLVLSGEQRAAADQIGDLFEAHPVVLLIGKAGTGKSVVVADVLGCWVDAGCRVMVTAISHKSLGQHRQTIAGLAVPRGSYTPEAAVWAKLARDATWWAKVGLGTAKSKPWYNTPAGTPKILVVEEFGLWTSGEIAKLDAILRCTFRARSMPFGGVRVLFVGDEGQIKPRGGKPASTHPLLHRAPRIELKESRRYTDSDWKHVLGDLQKPQIPGGLADQLVRQRRAAVPPEGALILGQSRADVREAVRQFREKDGEGILLLPSDPETIPKERGKDAEDGRFVGGLTQGWLVYGCVDIDTKARATERGTLLTNGTDIRFERVISEDGEEIEADSVVMGENAIVVVTILGTGEEVSLQPLELEGHFVVPIRHGISRPARMWARAR